MNHIVLMGYTLHKSIFGENKMMKTIQFIVLMKMKLMLLLIKMLMMTWMKIMTTMTIMILQSET